MGNSNRKNNLNGNGVREGLHSEQNLFNRISNNSLCESYSSRINRYNSRSKTVWPVTNIESYFLPEFQLKSAFYEKNFETVDFISHGAFGYVYKVIERSTHNLYALKLLSKSKIIRENSIQQVKDEVQIQRVCGHFPFIVHCPYHWQTRKHIYIVSDFVVGGELYKLFESYGIFPVAVVQVFIAEIALAIDFLHNAGIIYRDLKPENILLDADYHVQLVDFGLAKWLKYGSRTNTLCGTRNYMAPEVISMQSYGHAVDWWSLGVIACLMLTNQYPSGSDCSDSRLTPASRDLLIRLLESEPTKRLRSLRILQTIAFYMNFNFDQVRLKNVSPRELLNKYFPDGPKTNETTVEDIHEFNMNFL